VLAEVEHERPELHPLTKVDRHRQFLPEPVFQVLPNDTARYSRSTVDLFASTAPTALCTASPSNVERRWSTSAWTVYAAAEMLGVTLTAAEVGNACDWVSDAADYYDVRLRARFGGQVAFADAADGAPVG
jgi:hypothetical protein